MFKKKQKRAVTLLEMMIVIFLIGLIASVIGFNMKGSLDEGKVFKTRQAKEQIRDALLLEAAKNPSISLKAIAKNPLKHLQASEIVKDAKTLLKDGWGEPFEIKYNEENHDIEVTSKKLAAYDEKQKIKEEAAIGDVNEAAMSDVKDEKKDH